MLGAISVAAVGSVPVLADAALDDRALGGALLEAAATHVLVADAEQLDRVVRLRPDLPDLEIVLVFEPPGDDRPSPAMSVQEACARGRALLQEPPGRFEMPASTGPAAPALITVAEDGRLAEWTEDAVAASVRTFVERFDLRADDAVVLRSSSFDLPFLAAITGCLERGVVVAPDVARGGLIEAVPVLPASVVVAPARDLLERWCRTKMQEKQLSVKNSTDFPIEEAARLPLPGMAIPGGLAYSPDNRRIAYLYSPEGGLGRELFLFDTTTGQSSQVPAPVKPGEHEEELSPEERLRRVSASGSMSWALPVSNGFRTASSC